MRYVNDQSEIPKPEAEEFWFNKDGKEITGDNERFYAKTVVRGNQEQYYIRVHNNAPFDPIGIYGFRERGMKIDLKKVSKNTFDFYMMYLTTKNSLYMTRAQRGLHNG